MLCQEYNRNLTKLSPGFRREGQALTRWSYVLCYMSKHGQPEFASSPLHLQRQPKEIDIARFLIIDGDR